jgi:hypothetical protein
MDNLDESFLNEGMTVAFENSNFGSKEIILWHSQIQ